MFDETVTNRINALQPAYREYILSDMPGIMAEEFGKAYQFDEAKTDVLGNAIILMLVFLLDRNQFVEFVEAECGLPRTEAKDLAKGVMAALPEDIREGYLQTVNSLVGASSKVPSEPAVTIPSIPPEPIYTSTQSAILKEGQAATAAAKSDTPHWDGQL